MPTNTFSKRFHHNGAQSKALQKAFTDTFIGSHIAGGDHVGPLEHRARTNQRVPMSTVVSYGDAVELGKKWLAYLEAGAAAAAGAADFTNDPARPSLYTYTQAVRVKTYDKDADGRERDAWIRFTRNRAAPGDRRIHHLDSTEFTDPGQA